jgi:hypothetical protein
MSNKPKTTKSSASRRAEPVCSADILAATRSALELCVKEINDEETRDGIRLGLRYARAKAAEALEYLRAGGAK